MTGTRLSEIPLEALRQWAFEEDIDEPALFQALALEETSMVDTKEIKFENLEIPYGEYTDSREVDGSIVHYEVEPNPNGTVNVKMKFSWSASLGEHPFDAIQLANEEFGGRVNVYSGGIYSPYEAMARDVAPGNGYDVCLWER